MNTALPSPTLIPPRVWALPCRTHPTPLARSRRDVAVDEGGGLPLVVPTLVPYPVRHGTRARSCSGDGANSDLSGSTNPQRSAKYPYFQTPIARGRKPPEIVLPI